jgi:Ca2+-binding RTX toxin-like protein
MTPTPRRPGARALAAPVLAAVLAASAGGFAASALGMASHAGWPPITGMLLMNKLDQSRPLDGRPGADPFDGTDPQHLCDGIHRDGGCLLHRGAALGVPAALRHNELLGGNGNDTIHAGPAGDVIWGDYKPSGQPTTQVDMLYGGPGNDFIYTSHGTNYISTGGGVDVVHAHFGSGAIKCDSPTVTIHMSHASRRRYRLFGCPAPVIG